jgi:GDP/UDP-N,N'-diacetylbacillosamine 2-epimerase (hydrolysing)
MGEDSAAIHIVGAPGLDGLAELATIDRAALFATRGLAVARPTALVLFHPVLSEAQSSGEQMAAILDALADLDLQVLALKPNSDAGSAAIAHLLDERAKRDGFTLITHLPRSEFVSYLRHVDVLVGNSSSGIIEAATFGTPVVNIGSRQNLRQRNTNVHDADTSAASIVQAISRALAEGRDNAAHNVYGDGHAGDRIVAQLSRLDLNAARMGKTNAY